MIEESTYIEKNIPSKDDFDLLKKKGLELIQELSGKTWTDYNLHDPGVTILEQLCYVLTELNYLVGFDVEDFLCLDDGTIPFEDLALYKPLEIYPSENVTGRDYCKTIIDKVDGIRNIWIADDDENQKKGLYRFIIDASLKYRNQEEEICRNVRQVYLENRNLCEDIESIVLYEREAIEIAAIIEVNGEKSPNEILARILFECHKIISPQILFHSFRDLLKEDIPLDELLSGPELSRGYIKDMDFTTPKNSLSVSNLLREVFKIDGVEGIIDFYLMVDGEKITEEYTFADSTSGAYLSIPNTFEDLKIVLKRNDRVASINLDDILLLYYQMHNEHQTAYNTSKELAELCEMPKGNYTQFDEYFSLQNHFPDVYGINQYGIPNSAKPDRKAKAKQLKAYLILFEQIIVNCQSQMENMKSLLAIKENPEATYFTQRLKNIPHAKELFHDEIQHNDKLHDKKLKKILAKYDNALDRRNRLLDFLLSMYGERFHQKSFQEFNYYHSKEELKQILYANKVFWLKNIVKLNRYKSHSFNYQKSYKVPDNIAMIQLKTSLLLGIATTNHSILTDVIADVGLKISNRSFEQELFVFGNNHPLINLDKEYLNENFSIVKAGNDGLDLLDQKEVFDQLLWARDKEICKEVFCYGINPDQYRIGRLDGQKYHTLVFKSERSGEYLYLKKCKEKADCIKLAISMQQHLLRINMESEGMHIVEHILLRPEIKSEKHDEVPDDFYPFRISVILPNWSARFNNLRFRDYLQETFHINLPAHIYPEFYWLNHIQLRAFENMYTAWLECKERNENADKYSREIIRFLIDNQTVIE